MNITQIKIKVLGGALNGATFVFSEPTECKVGRGPDCTIRVPETFENTDVSRHHCYFDIDPPYLWLGDLDSTNGTYINGRKIHRSKDLLELVHDGDVVKVGNVELSIKIDDDPAEVGIVQSRSNWID